MKNYLGKVVDVIIDVPIGAKHPERDFIFTVNYGQLMDDKKPKAYVLGEFDPIKTFNGRVIAIIKRTNTNEEILVVAKTLTSYSEEQVIALTQFQERFFDTHIICCSGGTGKPLIRPIVLGLARRGNQILVEEGFDIIKNQTFYRALGGGIEFGETVENALMREFKEELDIEISVKDRICVSENIFTFDGKKGHQFVFIYNIELSKEDYEVDEFMKIEDNAMGKAFWIDKSEFLEQKDIIP